MESNTTQIKKCLRYNLSVKNIETIRKFILCALLFGVSVIVNPWTNFEPILVPKITFFAIFLALFLTFFYIPTIRKFGFEYVTSLNIFFISIIIVLILNHENLAERIFGVYGRNNGALTFCLLVMTAYLFSQKRNFNIRMFLLTLSSINIMTLFYSIMQFSGRDFYDWELKTSTRSIFATFGNPNFLSGFLSFSSVTFFMFFFKEIKKALPSRIRIIGFFLIFVLNVSVILFSGSALGLISLFAGLAYLVIFGTRLSNLDSLWTKKGLGLLVAFLLFFAAIVLLVLAKLQILDWQGSVMRRIDFWTTALRIFAKKPFFGAGFDTYNDNFPKFSASNSNLVNIYSSSSHSLFFDLLTSGGIVLTGAFLFVIWKTFQGIKIERMLGTTRDIDVLSIHAMWITWLIQSCISVPSVAVDIWGWSFMGIILSSQNAFRKRTGDVSLVQKRKLVFTGYVCAALVPVLLVLTISMYLYDSKFLNLAKSGDGLALSNHVLKWPQNSYYLFLVAEGLRNAGANEESRELEDKALKQNPMNRLVLRLVYERESDLKIKSMALQKLLSVDPNYAKSVMVNR
jgi:O-antigen ligase